MTFKKKSKIRNVVLHLFLILIAIASGFQPCTPRTNFKVLKTSTLTMARLGGSAPQDDSSIDNITNPINNNNDMMDYQMKLKEAERAMAAAEEARQKLVAANNKSVRPRPPPNSLARMQFSDAGTLLIEIPSKGLGTDSVFTGAFSLAWFSAIIPATFASGGASLLFMLPFWAAGGMVAKNAVFDPFVSGSLTVGKFAWSVENKYAKKRISSKEGPTEQLRGSTAEIVAVINGVPQAEIKLYTDSGITAFGLGLSIEELEYLAGEINDHLQTIRKPQDI